MIGNNMISFSKLSLASALLSIGLLTSAQAADIFTFDPDGAGTDFGPVEVGSIDFLPGNTLAVPVNPQDDLFRLYFQAKVNDLVDENTDPIDIPGLGQPGGFEITAVSQFDVVITEVTSSIVEFSLAPSDTNFFRLYRHDVATGADLASDLAGTGFFDGDIILEGQATAVRGGSFSFPFTAPFDGRGTDNYPGVLTELINGSVTVDVASIVTDGDFFLDDILTMEGASNLTAPFNQTNPSAQFDDGLVLPDIGTTNGDELDGGLDVQVQSDASASLTIPEPTTVALIGLAGLTLLGRRR